MLVSVKKMFGLGQKKIDLDQNKIWSCLKFVLVSVKLCFGLGQKNVCSRLNFFWVSVKKKLVLVQKKCQSQTFFLINFLAISSDSKYF